MINFKKILISLSVAMALSFTSTAAFSKSEGEQKARAAVEGAIASLEEALSLLEKGGDSAAVSKAVGNARQQQKEFRYEGTERQREKTVKVLVNAQAELKNGNTQPAEQMVRDALNSFKEMKAIYDKAH